MDVSIQTINYFFGFVTASLNAVYQQFCADGQPQYAPKKAAYDLEKARLEQLDSPDAGRLLSELHANFARSRAEITLNLQNVGARFVFTETERETLASYRREFSVSNPDAFENSLPTFLRDVAEQLLNPPPKTNTVPYFLLYIKGLYLARWESYLARKDAPDVQRRTASELFLDNPHWIAITNAFESLWKSVFSLGLISERQYKKIPMDPATSTIDRFELFHQNLKAAYELGKKSFDAETGFLYLPMLSMRRDGTRVPVRLFEPAEECLLQKVYGTDLEGYHDYFLTSERSEPPIMEKTFNKFWCLVEEALMIEYKITKETHLEEIQALIGRGEEQTALTDYASAIKRRLSDVEQMIQNTNEVLPLKAPLNPSDSGFQKYWLTKYTDFSKAHFYDMNYDILGDARRALLVAYSALNRTSLEALETGITARVLNKLRNLTDSDLFTGEMNLREEKLEKFTKIFSERLVAVVDQGAFPFSPEDNRDNLRVSWEKLIDNPPNDLDEDVRWRKLIGSCPQDEAEKEYWLGLKQRYEFVLGICDKDDAEARRWKMQIGIWGGGPAEMFRLRNLVVDLRGLHIDNQVKAYATVANLVELMAPLKQISSACAHTIWGGFLPLLMAFKPSKKLHSSIEMRFSGSLDGEVVNLPLLRTRYRAHTRSFYVSSMSLSYFQRQAQHVDVADTVSHTTDTTDSERSRLSEEGHSRDYISFFAVTSPDQQLSSDQLSSGKSSSEQREALTYSPYDMLMNQAREEEQQSAMRKCGSLPSLMGLLN